MKLQYLGFLPTAIVAIISHYSLIKTMIKEKDEWFLNADPLAIAISMSFWIMLSVIGFMWGVGAFN